MRRLTAVALALAVPSPLAGAEPVRISPRSFEMGSDAPRAEPNERPVHKVELSGFAIDRTEVTVGDYRACVDRGACAAPHVSSTLCTWAAGDDALPVNCVTWDEAATYCAAAGDRLPTEAEWELAAKGSSGLLYPWGNDQPSCEKAASMKSEKTAEGCGKGPRRVGSTRGASPHGITDMAGNVEEWVADFYDDRHATGEPRDPRGAPPGPAHVLRGGSFLSPWSRLRTTWRSWASTGERGVTVGFRCARDAAQPR